MSREEISNILLVGKFMEIPNLFPYYYKNENDVLGVYIAEDEDGGIDYIDIGINWYNPHSDWNLLMEVCKKIINMYYDRREDIFEGLQNCDIDKTYKACVEFIKFWNDDSIPKMTWNK